MEQYAHTLLEEVQEKVTQKGSEIIRDVETKMLCTFRFSEEQASALSSATAHAFADGGAAEPSPPPSPHPKEELSKVSQFIDELKDDGIANEVFETMDFGLDSLLGGDQGLGYDTFGADSAYYTVSMSGGGQGSFEVSYAQF
jgi:hypothetical protein